MRRIRIADGHTQTNNDSIAIVKLLKKQPLFSDQVMQKRMQIAGIFNHIVLYLFQLQMARHYLYPQKHQLSFIKYGTRRLYYSYKMCIHTYNGWTSFDEVSTAHTKYGWVEKFNGDWKLVAASMHFYKQP